MVQYAVKATPHHLSGVLLNEQSLMLVPPRAQDDRQWALRKGLDEINKEIEAASRNGVACWFPMGTRNERIVRLAAKEAQLLNSRLACARVLFLACHAIC